MSNYGMKVSRQGYDVTTCADHQLLWSSTFRLPVVTSSGIYRVGSDWGASQTITTHNLGYVPIVLMTFKYEATEGSDQEIFWGASNSDWSSFVYIGTSTIYYKGGGLPEDFPVSISWNILNFDMSGTYTAPIINSVADTQGAITQDYGFKVSKDGYGVGTASLDQLASFSGNSLGSVPVRHQLIQKIAGGTIGHGGTASIAHGLGYKPMFLFYGSISDGWFPLQYAWDTDVKIRTWADATNVNISHTAGDVRDYKVLILKDPLN